VETLYLNLCAVSGIGFSASRVALPLIMLCIFSSVAFTSWRGITKYYEFRGWHDDYREIVESTDLANALIFISNTSVSDFGSAYIFNSPDLSSSDPLFVRDLGMKANRALINRYPDKVIYFVEGRGKWHEKARLIAGPFRSVDQLPENVINFEEGKL
jgi:hypothetical protein